MGIPECPINKEFVEEYEDELRAFWESMDPEEYDSHCEVFVALKTYAMTTLDMDEEEVEELMSVSEEKL